MAHNGTSELRNIKRHAGIAGQYSYTVEERYVGTSPYSNEQDSDWATVTFVGSVYGGPVAMVTPSGMQTFVHADVMARCGSTLNEQWIRRFFE